MCNKCDENNGQNHGDQVETHDHSQHEHAACNHDHGHGGCDHGHTRDPSVRYYDDPHPATLVEGARNQWELYLREVRESTQTFNEVIADGKEALCELERLRKALGETPSAEAQKALIGAYEHKSMHWLHGAAMLYFTNIEAIGDAQTQLDLVGIDARPSTPERIERLRKMFENIERKGEKAREDLDAAYKAEQVAIEAACPQYDELVTKYVSVSGPAW